MTPKRPGREEAAGPEEEDDAIGAMAARLATEDGITASRQRGHVAETPRPATSSTNMRFGQLSLRGKRKAAAEWKFACAVRNLRTAISSGHLTCDALAELDARDQAAARPQTPRGEPGQAA